MLVVCENSSLLHCDWPKNFSGYISQCPCTDYIAKEILEKRERGMPSSKEQP
jgi:hypothetical protein